MRTSIFRALFAIVAGVLMIQYREEMVRWLTIVIGVLFFLSGLISTISYFVRRNSRDKEMFPIVGIGCGVLGIILALIPNTVAQYLVYVFAIILILGAVSQFVMLISVSSLLRDFARTTNQEVKMTCGYGYWVLPILLFLFGLLAIFYPHAIASAPFVFVGVAVIVYGCSELFSAVKSHRVKHYVVVNQVVVDDTPSEVRPAIEEQANIERQHPIEDAEIIEEVEEKEEKEEEKEEEK